MGQCMSRTGSALPAGVDYIIFAETLRCFATTGRLSVVYKAFCLDSTERVRSAGTCYVVYRAFFLDSTERFMTAGTC